MTKRISCQTGFTLLEMVIILGIVGSLLGAFFSFYQPTQIAQGNASTTQKTARIINALSSYALRNKVLPCPASPTETAAGSYGRANTSSAVCGSATGIGRGLIPYVDLGLSQDDIKDAFGRYLTYVVPNTMTTNPGGYAATNLLSKFCTAPASTSLIRVNRPSGVIESNIIVALIAHGSEGIGSYNIDLEDSAKRSCPMGTEACQHNEYLDRQLGTNERKNAVDRTDNNVYIDTYSTQKGTTHFDDDITYILGPNLLTRLGNTGCS